MPEHHANAGDDTRERIPTTVQVRHKYATVLDDTQGWRYSEEWGTDFDRWLADHIASAVQAERERVAGPSTEGAECCASGSCEVCQPHKHRHWTAGWAS